MKIRPDKIHLGIYGICVQDGKVLLIRKNRGPYKGLLDIPGGRIEIGEGLIDALRREYYEETGAKIIVNKLLCVCEYQCKWKSGDCKKAFHHIAIYHEVKLENCNIKEYPDGYDSDGANWFALPIDKKDISPIAYEAINKINLDKYQMS